MDQDRAPTRPSSRLDNDDLPEPPPSLGAPALLGSTPLRGSLPLDVRVRDGKVVETRAAVAFGVPHLRRPDTMTTDRADVAQTMPVAEAFADRAAALLGGPDDGVVPMRFARAEDATYDFDEYVLLRDRDDPLGPVGPTPAPADPRFARLESSAAAGIDWAVQLVLFQRFPERVRELMAVALELRRTLTGWWLQYAAVRSFNRLARLDPREVAATAAPYSPTTPHGYYGACLGYWLVNAVYEEIAAGIKDDAAAAAPLFTAELWTRARDEVFDDYFSDLDPVDPVIGSGPYPFEPVPADEAFFGLRVVHRQSWRQLGFGRGDLVGTVPLGPRESRKVSVKSTRRSQMSRSAEESRSFESSAESSTTAKDTSEVVAEASKATNKHAEAEVGGGYPPFVSAKISGGLSEDASSSSRNTKTALNERMQKTASRMKRDTKVTVSSEEEVTFEQSASSELTNPNDEVAVTYLYRRLQQRYWVSTSIDEVNSVIFVPEPVPAPEEINETWLTTHGEVIAGSLLDQSYAGVLAAVRGEPGNLAYPEDTVFRSSADTAVKAVASYGAYTGGGDLPDVLASGQQYFERDYERRTGLAMDQARRRHQLAGLLTHVRRNILYYLRAIWSSEDPDSRMRRYSGLRVPVEWVFVPRAPGSKDERIDVDGYFVPASTPPMPLDDVVDPVGPVGYLFNCAIWRVRDDVRLVNLHSALAHLRAAYTRFTVAVALSEGSQLTLRQAVAVAPRRFMATYPMIWREARGHWLIPVQGREEMDWIEIQKLPDGSLDVLGTRLWLDGTPADGEKVSVEVQVTADLEDPHVRLLRVQHPLPSTADEDAYFGDTLLEEMASLFDWSPAPADAPRTWTGLTDAEKKQVRDGYHELLMRRESGRLVTIDSANIVLDLEVGRSAALEPFKRLHRFVDVMKEHEELRRRELENRRREALLAGGLLGDPDIDRITVLRGGDGLSPVVVLDDAYDDDQGAPA